ncbi:proline--tRNA ligase [Candidatus Pacearchaeota archaeon]|nr:proline--tRNA ligase [Candidatus Pacearchaeota archaeon]
MTKETQEGLTVTKEGDFSEWYQELITKAELADYSSVSGCIVFRPRAYQIWEKTKSVIDKEFKKIGIQNSYFPLFIPKKLLAKESKHVEGFTPEVAWVTHAGSTKLNEKLAVRPTSEAIMYDSYSKWIRSHNDLPLKLNQWNNVVRWEFKHPVPFLRTREFLWNEGHNVYSNAKDLEKDRKAIMKIYQNFMKNYMALPSLPGKKSDKEKFAGAEATYSFELMLPNGKAIQGPDYHDDGQNFAQAYDINFLDKKGNTQFAYQSTYAITTRMLGVMFAIHSDNSGLIIPPKLAKNKVVIVPILFDKTKKKVLKKAKEIEKSLARFSPILDEREDYTPGWKFNEWELKGIPIRIEIGPKDLKNKSVTISKRTQPEKNKKFQIKISDLEEQLPSLLDEIQDELYKKAKKLLDSSKTKAKTIAELIKAIENKKIALAPVCGKVECEDIIKDKTGGAKTLNAPLNQKKYAIKGKKCLACNKKAKYHIYIGKSY